MAFAEKIIGKYVDLRSIDESDAEFSMNIRKDPEFTIFLPPINNTIEQQREWIKRQMMEPGDYFWIMLDKNGNKMGTFGIYDVGTQEPKGRSLIAKGNPLQNIEMVYLVYKYALEVLHADPIYGWVYADNTKAIRLNDYLGGIMSNPYESNGRMIKDVVFKNPEFSNAERRVRKMLYRE